MTTCKCGGKVITINHGETDIGKVIDEVCSKCGDGKRTIEPYFTLDYVYISVKLDEEESE